MDWKYCIIKRSISWLSKTVRFNSPNMSSSVKNVLHSLTCWNKSPGHSLGHSTSPYKSHFHIFGDVFSCIHFICHNFEVAFIYILMKNPRLWDSPAFWEEVSSVIGWVVLEVPAYLCIFIFNFPLCLKFQIIPKMHSASLWIFFYMYGSMKKEMGEYTFRAKLKMGKPLFVQTYLCQSFDV